ncbi:chromosome segregation protein SMC [Sphingobacterium spiritivorum]|uniref:Chromosome partition protein Smc n=1 Tax=Sphingobacterium spiritivorum ATCC 33861 TaxID=525373 RepID=D7VM73_SPHSI|nr:chromosome segregation protein SMC [Sphingobacterium spiritivorum]EFK58078.1 chromosome segregation protein SMC [Sphingobacterium spiritivorum ATCC 33861]QQT34662.1 chromosome segregation protein SMC [Sphingobacterium spiritivorum]WQD35546.1 chromosome segregation protein SMC [Sphingobacterium spiritivorum]SUJ00778.1 Chromosome partition protein Smc [Sphingobacterium spiritivorum]
MQLTKLEIKGFKSFGDKITINFNDGVTAIVGPNGCGKSNVVDAIRWVMGEQSTRALRSEKMENIIFNGTKNRKPANLAEVSLTFNNTKNILPTEFSTVNITRKLYRNGESEYRLNDVKCRLKDITDLFLDTGLGADTYSIIELKMIDEIINNKDNSRRNLFEEASGISKYKVRKKQTLSKLKETENDLSRVDDLLFEIGKNLKSLENQAKKADKYFRLKDEYKDASVSLAYFKLADFSQDLEKLEEQEAAQQEVIQQNQSQIGLQETELQEKKKDILAKEKNLSVQQKSTHEYVNKIRAYESEKKIKNEQMRHLQEKEARLSTELANDKQQLNHAFYNIKRLNEELFEEQSKFDSIKMDLEANKTEVEELRAQQQSAKAKLDSFQKERGEIQSRIYQLEKDIAVLNIQKDALQQESLRNVSDTASKETELNQFNIAVADLEGRVDSQQQQYESAIQSESELQLQITATESELQTIKDELNRQSRIVDAKQNEYNLTKSLVDNLEGFPESIRFLRKSAGWKKQFPLFSDILFCKEDYRVAVENYLEPIMNHYVVDSQQDAVQAIQLLSDASRGRANFFVLDAITSLSPFAPAVEDEKLIRALDVITVEEKYRTLCEILLQHVFILKHGESADLETQLPQDDTIILHKEGRFAKNRLGLMGGSVGLFEGKRIGRAKNLENLAKEIKTLNQQIVELQTREVEQSGKLVSLKNNSQRETIDELRHQLNRLNNELISVKTKQEQYQTFITNSHNRKQDIEAKITTITNDLLTADPTLQDLKIENQKRDLEVQDLQENFNEISEILTEKSAVFNQQNIHFHQQQNKVSGIQKDLEYRDVQKETFEARIEKNTIEYEEVQQSIKDTLQHVDHNDEDLLAMYAQKEALEKGLQDIEEDFYASRKVINDLEEAIAQLRKSKELTDMLIGEIKDKKTRLQIDLNALRERLSVEFNIDLKDLLETEPPETSLSQQALQITCEKIKKQLDEYGTINPMAKEAYDEMNERSDFITKEKSDLLEAKNSLMATIKEIDDSAKDKFMTAFTMIRENFIRVFRSLFNEEDSCDLTLSDPDNPLESDIDIIARPKGKRPLSINQLSGGEKTLTSTALLFSLYLLKPAPFCIFDEVDAPLDDTNIDKFNNIIREFSNDSQFIVVSHNKRTIASTDVIYGVTMVEQGISRVVAVDLRDVA